MQVYVHELYSGELPMINRKGCDVSTVDPDGTVRVAHQPSHQRARCIEHHIDVTVNGWFGPVETALVEWDKSFRGLHPDVQIALLPFLRSLATPWGLLLIRAYYAIFNPRGAHCVSLVAGMFGCEVAHPCRIGWLPLSGPQYLTDMDGIIDRAPWDSRLPHRYAIGGVDGQIRELT